MSGRLIRQSPQILFAISVMYFLLKGFQYYTLGSFLPLIVALIGSMLFIFSLTKIKWIKRPVQIIWALFLVVWCLAIVAIEVTLLFSTTVTEAHIRDQMGVKLNVLVLLFLYLAFRLLKKEKAQGDYV